MNNLDAHRAARALADFGHIAANGVPFVDLEMAATLARVPAPQSLRDRIQICAALEDLNRPTDHQRPTT